MLVPGAQHSDSLFLYITKNDHHLCFILNVYNIYSVTMEVSCFTIYITNQLN